MLSELNSFFVVIYKKWLRNMYIGISDCENQSHS